MTKTNDINDEILEQLLAQCEDPSKLLQGDFLQNLKRQLVNKALEAA